MKEVNLYIETSSTAFQKKERNSGYVLEYIKGKTPITREGFRTGKGTYNQEILETLTEALKRVREPCKICIYSRNQFVLYAIRDKMEIWAREDFEKIKNQEDWKALWEVIQEHEVNVQVGKHTYSDWILREMEERREKKRVRNKRASCRTRVKNSAICVWFCMKTMDISRWRTITFILVIPTEKTVNSMDLKLIFV